MIFKLKRKVEKGERNDKMIRTSKSKAITSQNYNVEFEVYYCWVVGNNLWCTSFNSTTSLINSWFLVIPLPNHALLSYRMISRVLCSGFIHLARKTFLPSNCTVISVWFVKFLSWWSWLFCHPSQFSMVIEYEITHQEFQSQT